MAKAWVWIKKWGAAIAGLLLVLLGAGWMWRRKQAEVAKLKDEAAVATALREMEALRAVRERLHAEEKPVAAEIAAIDQQLKDNKRKIVEAHEGMQNIPDADIDDAFSRLGY